jgi:hypothetical protein
MCKSDAGLQAPYFYAAEQRGWLRDRLFRVYVNERMVAGVYIAGQVREDPSFWEGFARRRFLVKWLILPVVKRILARRAQREAFYDRVDPFEEGLANLDRRNFQIPGSEIVRIRFRHKHLRYVIGSVAIVHLCAFDGTSRRLVVMGNVEPEGVVEGLRLLDPAIEVEGVDPFKSCSERRRIYALRDLSRAGAIALWIGIGAAAVWALELINDLRVAQLAVWCIVCGCWTMLKAWKMSRASQKRQSSIQ